MSRLVTEKKVVQEPFLKYADKAGWKVISQEDALSYRRGEEGKFFYDILEKNLIKLNEDLLSKENIQEIVQKLEAIPDTLEGNKQVLDWLRGQKTFYDIKEKRNRNVKVIDFESFENNDFFVTEEWSQVGVSGKTNRADIMLLINGIPIAIIENKNSKKIDAMEEAIVQLNRYERETPEIISCSQIFNITHLIEYFYGVTWNYSRKNIFNWKKEISDKRERNITLEEAIKTFFKKGDFLILIKEWILFFNKDNELQKTVLKQHQTRAIDKIYNRCMEENKNRGLIWHTQGSGKTFTMIASARKILEKYPNATVMMIIDRNELEGQLSGWIDSLIGESQQSQQTIPIRQARSEKELQQLLGSDFRGLIISMIHKFNEIKKDSCTRDDFYILIDEAHRSVNKDLGTCLMAALPNATIFGFTGTPIDRISYGKGTFKIFGKDDKKGYLDKYSIQESIGDGTTLKLRHTIVSNQMRLSDELLETEFLAQAESEGISDVEDLNKVLKKAVKLKTFLKSNERVKKVTEYIVKHFRENVEPLGYKAFIVAVDREACTLYKKNLDKHLPEEYSQIVYSKGLNDSRELSKYTISDDKEQQIRKSFKKQGFDPKILIVTDKLLTGYDAPILYCMYLDKPMRDHVLLQAIARVNRPYEDNRGIQKPCGLIMDFIGIFKNMKKALSFDSDEVTAVIEDLELLFNKFKDVIEKDFNYLPLSSSMEGGDKKIEKIIYEDFSNLEKRKDFIKKVKELEAFYEILSPDQRLHPYLPRYQRIIEIYKLLINAYREKSKFLGSLSKKTEKLIREKSKINNFNIGKTFDINTETLKKIKEDQESADSVKIMNLIKTILETAEKEKNENPVLISIEEKANSILENFKEKQEESKKFLEELLKLSCEIIDSRENKKNLGMEKDVFLIYWLLSKYKLENSKTLASEIDSSFKKFQHFNSNSEELRQLKINLYRTLISLMDEEKMIKLTEVLIKSRRKIYESG